LRSFVLESLRRENGEKYDIEVSGIRTRCHVGDNASEIKLLLDGPRKDRAQLRQVLRHLPAGGTFIDVGSNFGLYALHAARKVGPAGKVLAIEPNTRIVQRLRFNIASNSLTNVAVEDVAVGEAPEMGTLTFDPAKQGAGTLAITQTGESQAVKIVPLAQLLEKHWLSRVDALKIDVEGYEDRAILPLLRSTPISLWPRMILMEVSWRSRWKKDCVAALSQSGYREIWKGRDDRAFLLEIEGGD
jgi:FkbM family methyltransferase